MASSTRMALSKAAGVRIFDGQFPARHAHGLGAGLLGTRMRSAVTAGEGAAGHGHAQRLAMQARCWPCP